jgi:tetratricopeptide (TPR) repeat protein
MKKIVVLLSFIMCTSLYAQNTATHNQTDRLFYDALELYDKEKYGSAKEMFELFIQSPGEDLRKIEAEYYSAVCALELFHNDAETRFVVFLEKYPYHVKAGRVGFDVGNFFYRNKNYDKAVEYYTKVEYTSLTGNERNETYFKLGYSYLTKKDFDNALTNFDQCKGAKHKYTFAANYYAGYIEFKKGEYDKALVDLQKSAEHPDYSKLVPVLICNIYYRQGKYEEVIPYAENVLDKKLAGPNTNDVKLILADSYFFTSDFAKANTLFKEYLTSTGTKGLTPDIKYRIGYAAYKTNDYAQSIKMLKDMASDKDSLGQSSAYILGLSYLKSGEKTLATTAMQLSYKSSFNAGITEEALFTHGKLCYELSRFSQATKIFKTYLDQYPKGSRYQESVELLTDSYMGSRDFDDAIQFIEGLKARSMRVNISYQRICYYKGVELFNKANYAGAIEMFDKSLKYPLDKQVHVNALYWKGESYSMMKNYQASIIPYEVLINYGSALENENVNKAYYSLGYSYYYLKDWEKSIKYFKVYLTEKVELKGKKDKYYADAQLRLADLYFVTRRFPEAIKNYDLAKLEATSGVDYILFQMATIQDITDKKEAAYQLYGQIVSQYPTSTYVDKSLLQKGDIDLNARKYEAAISEYTQLINKPIDAKGYKVIALQKRGIAYYNLKQYDKAVADNMRIMEDYITTPEAYNALLSIQQIYQIQGKESDFSEVLTKYQNANPKDTKLKDVEYSNAKGLYSAEKYQSAADAFVKFISRYPDQEEVKEASYLLADSYYRSSQWTKALAQYKEIEAKQDQYYKKSVARQAEIYSTQKDYVNAIKYWNKVLPVATTNRDKANAWNGLMESYFETQKYDSCVWVSQNLIANGTSTPEAENKALLYQGKSYYKKGDLDQASDILLSCLNGAKDVNSCEAHYLLAQISYDKKQYQSSIETLYDFNNIYFNYDYWYGKSFLLIAENYIALNDMFQAKETLKSIVGGAKNTEIKDMAAKRLKEIEGSTVEGSKNE